MYIYLYIKRTTAIFDFDHIDKSIDENQLDEIKALYRFYHKFLVVLEIIQIFQTIEFVM